MKVLIATNHLNDYAGSELFTVSLAKLLRERGSQVLVFSPVCGEVARELLDTGIPVTDDLRDHGSDSFDIIHAHHATTAILSRSVFPRTPMVMMIHGVLAELEQPPTIDLGIARYLAVSEEVKEHLVKDCGISEPRVEIVRNFVDTRRFQAYEQVEPAPRTLLVVSNHYTKSEKDIVEKACLGLKITAKHVGLQHTVVTNVEAHINAADIVLSLGRGALEAMACERNVIIYDEDAADGFVDENNFHELKKNNFSGRRYKAKYRAEDLKREILKYDPAVGKKLRKIIERENSPDRTMDRIESIYRTARDDSDISCQITCGQLYRETYYTTQLYKRLIHLDIRGRQMKKRRKKRPYLSLLKKSDTK